MNTCMHNCFNVFSIEQDVHFNALNLSLYVEMNNLFKHIRRKKKVEKYQQLEDVLLFTYDSQ